MELSAWSSYGLLSLLGGVANLLLGTAILTVDPRNKLNRLYALCTDSIAWWAFMKVGVANSLTLESAAIHYRFVTASVGVSTSDPKEPGHDESELFRLADWALLTAKRAGKNRVVHADEVDRGAAKR